MIPIITVWVFSVEAKDGKKFYRAECERLESRPREMEQLDTLHTIGDRLATLIKQVRHASQVVVHPTPPGSTGFFFFRKQSSEQLFPLSEVEKQTLWKWINVERPPLEYQEFLRQLTAPPKEPATG